MQMLLLYCREHVIDERRVCLYPFTHIIEIFFKEGLMLILAGSVPLSNAISKATVATNHSFVLTDL